MELSFILTLANAHFMSATSKVRATSFMNSGNVSAHDFDASIGTGISFVSMTFPSHTTSKVNVQVFSDMITIHYHAL